MNVHIATTQYPIQWHKSLADWAEYVESWVSFAAFHKTQITLFPEYGSMELVSLFSESERQDLQVQLERLQTLVGPFQETYARLARKYGMILVAPSFPVAVEGNRYNRTWVFSPKGLAGYQDKFFMTRFEHEIWGIQAGVAQLKVFEADWGSFGIQTCYDVEFPIGSALLNAAGAQLILAPSCTETIRGATRVHVGARARALENQCLVAVSQTMGDAPWSPAVDINYGYAALYATPDSHFPEEGILAVLEPGNPGWIFQNLDFSLIEAVRKEGQVFNFKDQQDIAYTFRGEQVQVLKHLL